MKFTCPKCATRYTLPDEKVPPGAALRFACKKCDNVMRVKRGGVVEAAAAAPRQAPKQMAEPAGESTRVASIAEIRALKEESERAVARAAAPEWFLMVAGEQRGPLDAKQVRAMLSAKQIDRRTYAWHEGMEDWRRIEKLPELSDGGGDAGKVVRPVEAPVRSTGEATVAMNASQLHAELEKLRTAAAPPEPIFEEQEEDGGSTSAPDDDEPAVPEDDEPLLLSRPKKRGLPKPAGDDLFDAFDSSPEDAAPSSPFDDEPSSPLILPKEDSAPGRRRDGPPGESTKAFMADAGLFKRRRRNRIAAITALSLLVVLIALGVMDATGVVSLPVMGGLYDATGLEDPNLLRAVERTEAKLATGDLSPEERESLGKKLLGLKQSAKLHGAGPEAGKDTPKDPAKDPAQDGDKRPEAPKEGGAQAEAKSTGAAEPSADKERALAAEVYGDARKQEVSLKLADPAEIQVPNLPAGLTQEAILEVVSQNSKSMQLCLEEAIKKGDKPPGRIEVEITIASSGAVSAVDVPGYRTSTMGGCTMRRVKGWKFPRFNGQPVTVVFPYLLSTAF